MHILKKMNTLEPPIVDLSPKDVNLFSKYSLFQKFQKIWEGEKSLKNSLVKVINCIEDC